MFYVILVWYIGALSRDLLTFTRMVITEDLPPFCFHQIRGTISVSFSVLIPYCFFSLKLAVFVKCEKEIKYSQNEKTLLFESDKTNRSCE